jgi:hypothetical protein
VVWGTLYTCTLASTSIPASHVTRMNHTQLALPSSSYQGQVGAALVLGGVDATGPHLFTIHPHGSTDKLPYVTMGSGSLAAMAVFERGWRGGMTVSSFMSPYLFFSVCSVSAPPFAVWEWGRLYIKETKTQEFSMLTIPPNSVKKLSHL